MNYFLKANKNLLPYLLIILIAIPIFGINFFISFLGKQEGLDQQIIAIAAQILPPSVVELVETTLFYLIDNLVNYE